MAADMQFLASAISTSFDFNSPAASTASHSYTDLTAPAAQQRYYVVRAEDEEFNEETNTFIVGKYDLELVAGYNLVALPLVPFDNDIDAVLHHSITYNPLSEVRRFDNDDQEFKTQMFLGITWNPLAFQSLNYGEGYFFKADAATDLTLVGTLPEATAVSIKQGMNLFGLASLETKQITDVIAGNATEVGKRNMDGSYSLATFIPNTWHNSFLLEPGTGYWLKATHNHDLVLQP